MPLSATGALPAARAAGMAPRSRLVEVDSLRGIAASMVLAFHFTYKYDEVYHYQGDLPFSVPWGYLGVNLFFVISGFVIFMTLDRTRVAADFVVSRVSRLFPAYWTAIVLTFCITMVLGLPGKIVSWRIALLNLPMFHQLFGITPVDGVYWTLLVELLFYTFAFALYVTGNLRRVLPALWALLALRVLYWAFAAFAGIDLPWRLRQLLILDYIPFFALGIVAFHFTRRHAGARYADGATAAAAIAVLALVESGLLAAVALACFAAVWLAATGRLALLRARALVWLGTISYPLYLLHENIGWAVLRQLQMHDVAPMAAIGITVPVVLALAAAVSYSIEYPAMAWIRRKYRESHPRVGDASAP
jgi:peptidoglycan/LPS O-acetylase OafA/YrhL